MAKSLPLIAAISAVVVVVTVLLYPNSTPTNTQTTDTVNVAASFYPIAEFARQVGGNAVTVTTVTPAGTEPHAYEPGSQEVASIYQADLFLYNGGGMDAWADRIATDVANHGVVVVNLQERLAPESTDPHLWLSPELAKQEVSELQKLFSQADPIHADTYATNAAAYEQKLTALQAAYETGLADCENRNVVTSHDAFGYLAKAYNFTIEPISGISPEEEPSAGRLAEIANMAKEQNIKYIYFETLVSSKLAETIANEIGAQTLVFNPLEGLSIDEVAQGKNYVTVMEENLQNLRTGMVCR